SDRVLPSLSLSLSLPPHLSLLSLLLSHSLPIPLSLSLPNHVCPYLSMANRTDSKHPCRPALSSISSHYLLLCASCPPSPSVTSVTSVPLRSLLFVRGAPRGPLISAVTAATSKRALIYYRSRKQKEPF